MATYKVIQDIEAEDKLLGPLSLRQFIYAVICMGSLFMCYFLVSRAGTIGLLFTPLFLIPAAFFGFLAFPFSKDQPTELWALARMNYYFRPRRRVWNQSAARELVTVTAPKRVERNYTNGLSQIEVRSRLSALAQTLDSRGWAVKNASQTYIDPLSTNPDRLIDASTVPQEVANEVYTDVYDPAQGSTAQHFDAMLRAGEEQKRATLMQQMQAPIAAEPPAAPAAPPAGSQSPQDFWFMNQPQPPAAAASVPDDAVMFNSKVVNPGTDDDDTTTDPAVANEGELLNELKEQEAQKPKAYSHLPTIQPLDVQRKQAQERHQEFARGQAVAAEQSSLDAARSAAAAAYGASADDNAAIADDQAQPANPAKPVTPARNADILNYVNNDDLDLATISRQLNKPHQNDDGSVEISLH
jgi:hypothetical protein